MKVVSIFFAALLLVLTITSLYEIYEIPKEWSSPLIPVSIVEGMQKAYIAYAIINFTYFIPFLYVAIKRQRLAKAKILGTIFLLYIATIIVISFIGI